jgi:predicted nucleotidyltransferase
VFIFGSVAQGKATDVSDLDIMVETTIPDDEEFTLTVRWKDSVRFQLSQC